MKKINIGNRRVLSDAEIESFKDYEGLHLEIATSNNALKFYKKWLFLSGAIVLVGIIGYFFLESQHKKNKDHNLLTINNVNQTINKNSESVIELDSANIKLLTQNKIKNEEKTITYIYQPTNADSIKGKTNDFLSSNVIITPNLDTLLKWQSINEVTILIKNGNNQVSHVEGSNIHVEKISNDRYRLIPYRESSENKGKLYIYCKDKDGISRLNSIKTYEFAEPKMPIVTINNVKQNSNLLKDELLFAELKANHLNKRVKILSFNLIYKENGVYRKIYHEGSNFPIEMRNIFRKLERTDEVRFIDIKVQLQNGYIETVTEVKYLIE